jgi:VanZ family protein
MEIFRHYLTWTKNGRPDITENERNIALYLFDEKTGSVIHDRAAAAVDLHIPETYAVVDKIALEPLWKESSFSRSYWKNNLINVVGFLPVGFVFYAYFRVARPIRKAMLATLAVGTATSLTIEVLQAFLPTRDSGTTDLITNTFGTYLGVLCFRDIYPTLTKKFPWLSWFLAPHGDKVNEVLPEKNWKTLPRCSS